MRYFDRNTWFWIFLSSIFFVPILGGEHLQLLSEVRHSKVAQEMLATGDYLRLQLNAEAYHEHPPFFTWLQVLALQILGNNTLGVTFPNAFLGLVVIIFLYISGKFLIDRRFGFLWATCWFGSILPFLYFKSGILEPTFNFFTFAGIFFLIHYIWKKNSYRDLYFSKSKTTYLWLAGICIGLALLTKGPLAYFLTCLIIFLFWITGRFKHLMSLFSFLKLSLIIVAVPLVWVVPVWLVHGPEYIHAFSERQWQLFTNFTGYGSRLGPHLLVLVFGCFPASIFAIRALRSFSSLPFHIRDFQRWMVVMLISVLFVFGLLGFNGFHDTSLAFYPLTFLSALAIWKVLEKRLHIPLWLSILLVLVVVPLSLASLAVPWVGMNPETAASWLDGVYSIRSLFPAGLVWSPWDYVPGIWLVAVAAFSLLLLRRNTSLAVRLLFFGTTAWVVLVLIFIL